MITLWRVARVGALAALLATVAGPALCARSAHDRQDMNEVRRMMQKMKTMCVGRFLIDVPDVAATSFRPAFLSGWNISSNPEQTDQEFTDQLADKEAELKAAKNRDGTPNRYTIAPVKVDGFTGKFFISGRYWDTWNEGGKKVTGEVAELLALVRKDGVSFRLFATERGPEETAQLTQIISQIRPLAEGEIPKEPGFCFGRAIILDPLTASQLERVTMFVGLYDHRDVSTALDTAAGLESSPPLLERVPLNSTRLEYPDDFHVFRRHARNIGPIEGQENLERVRENDGVESHNFRWESINNDKNDVFKPELSFELSDGYGRPGEQLNASLSDEAVLALWDKMLSSLRVRPTRPFKPAAGPVAAPATQAVAGTPCPQSGWWRCDVWDERIKVDGAQTRYCRVGERMDQASILLPRTLWQRLRGKQPTAPGEVPTRWNLVNARSKPRGTPPSPLAPAAAPAANPARPPAEPTRDAFGDIVRAPVGTRAHSRDTCPESGWWLCEEPGALDGARWFRRGDILPPATLQRRQTWYERFAGKVRTQRSSTLWRLARLDEGAADAAINPGDADPVQAAQAPAPPPDKKKI